MIYKALRQEMAARAQHERELAAMKRKNTTFVEVPFEWQTKQTQDAAFFPSYGWIPHTSLRWRRATGEELPWVAGRQGDTFLMEERYANRLMNDLEKPSSECP